MTEIKDKVLEQLGFTKENLKFIEDWIKPIVKAIELTEKLTREDSIKALKDTKKNVENMLDEHEKLARADERKKCEEEFENRRIQYNKEDQRLGIIRKRTVEQEERQRIIKLIEEEIEKLKNTKFDFTGEIRTLQNLLKKIKGEK